MTVQIPGRLAVMAVSLVPLLGACAGAIAPVHLPPKAPAAKAAAVSAPPRQTKRQQVVAAYTGYTSAMAAAFASRSPARVSQLLRPYLDAAAIQAASRAFSRAWARNEVSYGQLAQHIIAVRILGTAAWVHVCDNASGSGLRYAGTGQLVPGSLGTRDENIVTRLNLVRGHWVVWLQTIVALSCTP